MCGKKAKLAFGFLVTLALVLASCAPVAAPTPTSTAGRPKPGTSAAKPAASPGAAAPTPKLAAEQPRYGGILSISNEGDPLTLDMHQESSDTVQNVLQCAYNGVTQFDPNNPEEVISDLAKTWEVSKDGLTYTFHLHGNVKFHDGTPFVSEDVKYSFERQFDPPKGVLAQRRADLGAIDRIEAPDKDTVKFILKYPSTSFLDVISSGWMVIYSKAFVEKKGHMRNDVMGTGPHRFKAYSPGTSLEYVKNLSYFVPGRPYLDGITFYIIRDAATRLAAFRTGRVKLTGPGSSALTAPDAETVRKTMPQAIVMAYPSFNLPNFVFNTQQQPWTDIRVRKAAHLAIDRQNAIAVLVQGYGELGSHMPGKWGIPKDELLKIPGWRQPKDADIAEAKRLLAEAGYPEGFTVKALVRASREHMNVAIYVADQMAKVGIKLELDVKEMAVRTKLVQEGSFNCLALRSALAFPDPENVARFWAAPLRGDWGMNYQRSSDQKIWELFDKQSRALDPAERKKIVRELDLAMIELASRPMILWMHSALGMWPEVKDRGKLVGNYSFQKYQDVWLAK